MRSLKQIPENGRLGTHMLLTPRFILRRNCPLTFVEHRYFTMSAKFIGLFDLIRLKDYSQPIQSMEGQNQAIPPRCKSQTEIKNKAKLELHLNVHAETIHAETHVLSSIRPTRSQLKINTLSDIFFDQCWHFLTFKLLFITMYKHH